MHRPSWAIALIIAALSAGCEGDPFPDESTESAIVVGRDDRTGGQHDAVVRLPGCTGTLVTPRHVLTAGQCVNHDPPTEDTPYPDGHNWEAAGRWYPLLPPKRDQAGMTSGVRVAGRSTVEPATNRPGGDYRSQRGLNADACRAQCDAEAACVAYTHSASSNTCWLKHGGFEIRFGADSNAWTHRVRATHYNIAGVTDIMLLALESPVPDAVATPIPVMTSLPAGETITSWMTGKRFRMAGWGYVDAHDSVAAVRRQTAYATFEGARHRGHPNRISVRGERGAGPRPGDSGGPLLYEGGWGPFVVGTVQGAFAGGGTYMVTFGPGGVADDGVTTPNLGRWLQSELRVSGVDWTAVDRVPGARRIAADIWGNVYRHDGDGRVLVSASGGAPGTWAPYGRAPANLRALTAATAGVFYQADDRVLYELRPDGASQRIGRPFAAMEVALQEDPRFEFPQMYARNDDGSLWRNDDIGSDGRWRRIGADGAARNLGVDYASLYALSADGTLRHTSAASPGTWASLGRSPLAIDLAVVPHRVHSLPGRLYRLDSDGRLFAGRPRHGDTLP